MKILNRTDLSLIKCLAIFVMVVTHCRFFYSLYHPFQGEIAPSPNFLFQLMSLTGLISLCIPLIAGQELFERLTPFMVGGKIRQFNQGSFTCILVIVALLDPLKSFLAEGLIYSFRWNALPLISLCLFILVQWNKKLKSGFSLLLVAMTLVATPFLVELFKPMAILRPDQYQQIIQSPFSLFYLILFLAALLAIFFYLQKNMQSLKSSVGFWILTFAYLVLAAMIYQDWQKSPSFVASIINLPFASLVPLGPLGGHIWPLFPWGSLVFFGYWFQWLEHQAGRNTWIHWFTLAISLLVIAVSFTGFYSNYISLLDANSGYSSSIFSLSPIWFPTLFAIYVLTFYALKLIATPGLIQKPLVKLVSSGILTIYVVHYVLAARLAPLVSQRINGMTGYWVYLLLVYGLTLGLSGFLIYVYHSPIRVVLSKRRHH